MTHRVLIACEYSGRVRNAFKALGIEAFSCDLIPAEDGAGISTHYVGDVRDILHLGWDLMIVHPDCTYFTTSGNRWESPDRKLKRAEAWKFVKTLIDSDIPRIAIENPIGRISTIWRKPDQIIQPWQFGEPFVKGTCLWLEELPPLTPTKIVSGRLPIIHHAAPGPDRKRFRSRTFEGIARAMAEQWGPVLNG